MIDPTCDHWSQNTNIFKLNKNTIFPYSSSFDPVSSPSNHLLKNHFFTSFLFRIRPFCEKWIILIYHSSYGNFLEAGNWQNPLCWIRTTSQVALNTTVRPFMFEQVSRDCFIWLICCLATSLKFISFAIFVVAVEGVCFNFGRYFSSSAYVVVDINYLITLPMCD